MDIVLPAAMNFERLAPFAVHGRRIFGRTPIQPAGECREDWRIALEIGSRLGYPETFFHGDVEAACNSILGMWNISYEDLRARQEQGITIPAAKEPKYRKYESGDMRPDGSPGFPTPSGKIEAFSTDLDRHGYPALPEYAEPMQTSPDYPLILVSGSRVPYITHSKWREDAPWLLELQNEPVLSMHPRDAGEMGIASGDGVRLQTPWGRMEGRAKATIMVPPGVVAVMHGWAGANVNELIPREFDPISGFPPYKEVVCAVTKI